MWTFSADKCCCRCHMFLIILCNMILSSPVHAFCCMVMKYKPRFSELLYWHLMHFIVLWDCLLNACRILLNGQLMQCFSSWLVAMNIGKPARLDNFQFPLGLRKHDASWWFLLVGSMLWVPWSLWFCYCWLGDRKGIWLVKTGFVYPHRLCVRRAWEKINMAVI